MWQDSLGWGGGLCQGRCSRRAGRGASVGGTREQVSERSHRGRWAGAQSWAKEDIGLSHGLRVWGWQGPSREAGVQVAGGVWMLEVIGGL